MMSNNFSEQYNIIQERTSEIICFIQQGETRFTSEILIEIIRELIKNTDMSESEQKFVRNDLRWIEKKTCRELEEIEE